MMVEEIKVDINNLDKNKTILDLAKDKISIEMITLLRQRGIDW